VGEDGGVNPTQSGGKFDIYKRGGCTPMVLPSYEQARKLEPQETRDANTFSASDKNFTGHIT
jgi:hypothetical protein